MKTFDELRLEYLEKNPPQQLLDDVIFSKKHTKTEFIKVLESKGVSLSERTLNFYINIGIVEKPLIGPKKQGKGKESYFSSSDVARVVVAKRLQEEGYSLDEILNKAILQENVWKIKRAENEDLERKYFKSLSVVLVENLPSKFTAENIKLYGSFIISDPDYESKLFCTLIDLKAKVDGLFEPVAKLVQAHELGIPEKFIKIFFDEMWDLNIDALFGEFSKNKNAKEVSAISLLSRSEHRMKVIESYFAILLKAYIAIGKALAGEYWDSDLFDRLVSEVDHG